MCKNCQSKPVYEFTNKRKLCSQCFVKYFQKKVFYTIRKFDMIKQNEIVSYKKGDGFREVVLEDVLKILVGKGIIELVKLPTKKKIDKIAIGQTTDLAAYEIVQEIIKGDAKKLDVGPMQREVIKPLYLFLNKEVLLYAKLRKLRFKKGKEQKNKISKFVDELEIKHPEIKRAVVKAWLKMSD